LGEAVRQVVERQPAVVDETIAIRRFESVSRVRRHQ
jgi:hypothetical protein